MAMENDEDFDSLFDGMDFVVNPLTLDADAPLPPSQSSPLDPQYFSSGPSSNQDQVLSTSESATDQHQDISFSHTKHRGALPSPSSSIEPQISIDSIMAAYNATDPRPSLTNSVSFSKASFDSSKPGIRRKKRSVRIGYGRGLDDTHNREFDDGVSLDDIYSQGHDDAAEEQGQFRLDIEDEVNSNGNAKDASMHSSHTLSQDIVLRSVSLAGVEDDIKSTPDAKGITLSVQGVLGNSSMALEGLETLRTDTGASMMKDETQEHANTPPAEKDTQRDAATLLAVDELPAEEVSDDAPLRLAVVEDDIEVQGSANIGRHEFEETSAISSTLHTPKVNDMVDGFGTLDLHVQIPTDLTFEKSLQFIKDALTRNEKLIQRRIASVSHARKMAAQKRRQMAEKVTSSSSRFKEVEQQVEAACEREDFEQAEHLSDTLAAAEKAREAALGNFRDAEVEYEKYASMMQEVIQMQVVNEEEGAQLLEQLGQDALVAGNQAKEGAEEKLRKEMDLLTIEEEAVKLKKKKLLLELKVIEEAKSELSSAIESSILTESQEQQLLLEEKQMLLEELDNLLDAVKVKQVQIAECDNKLKDVEDKIDHTVGGFEKERKGLEAELESLSFMLEALEKESEGLVAKKSHVDSEVLKAQEEERNLEELTNTARMEAQKLRDALQIRKSVSLMALSSKGKQLNLALTEKQHVEIAQSIRRQTAALRMSLQESASLRVKLQQESQLACHQISLMEKRAPEIEAEKKLAAAARNFKEAGRLASEAKSLVLNKDKMATELDRIEMQLKKLDEDVESQMKALSELEEQMMDEEKDAAMARCERLRLLAATTREERDAAAELEDFEEAESLHIEAEAADQEADELKKRFSFDGEVFSRPTRDISPRSTENVDSEGERIIWRKQQGVPKKTAELGELARLSP